MSENRLNKLHGAKPVKNSGRGVMKGDAVLHPFLIDWKEFNKSYTLNVKAWRKHASDAWEQSNREAMIVLNLDGELTLAILDFETVKWMRKCMLYVEQKNLEQEVDQID